MISIGIDEVGRGCWAGPLVAGAVVLDRPIAGLKDSKKLTKKQRENLSATIHLEARAYGLGWVWPDELDRIGLTTSVARAMERALAACLAGLKTAPGVMDVIIDGNFNYLPEVTGTRAVIRADDTVPAASAASIIAKVARDNYMSQQAHAEYPEYGFASHVGYGTAAHVKALAEFGVTDIHRKSFKPILKFMLHSSP